MGLESYKELIVWQKSMGLVTEIYRATGTFPKSEMYGLANQMRRASVSIPSNIAEGYTRKHRPEYIQFLRHAFASGAELETQVTISKNLKFINDIEFKTLYESLTEVMKMLNKLITTLVAKP